MKRSTTRSTLVVAAVLVACVALAPAAASAAGRQGGAQPGNGGRHPSGSHGFHQGQAGHRHFGRPFARTYLASPIVYYAPYYYPPSALSYDQQPAYDSQYASAPSPYYGAQSGYGGMVSVAPPPPPPNSPYPMGAMPYPAPPAWSAPPYPMPPPPTGMDEAPPTAPDGPAPRRLSRVYHWTDDEGVTHWTDRLDSVPPKYRDAQ